MLTSAYFDAHIQPNVRMFQKPHQWLMCHNEKATVVPTVQPLYFYEFGVAATPFGFGPYLFSPGALSVAAKIINQTAPTIGIKFIKNIQPLLPMSCNLLTETAVPGMKTAA